MHIQSQTLSSKDTYADKAKTSHQNNLELGQTQRKLVYLFWTYWNQEYAFQSVEVKLPVSDRQKIRAHFDDLILGRAVSPLAP